MVRSLGELDNSHYTELATKHLDNVTNFRGIRITGKAWSYWHCGRRMMKVVGIYQDATTRRERTWTSKQPLLFCTHPECGYYKDTSQRNI